MRLSRRGFMATGAAGSLALLGGRQALGEPAAGRTRPEPTVEEKRTVAIRIGAMDGVLGGGGSRALEVAKRVGIEGVEADSGRAEDTLRICRPEVIEGYQAAGREQGVAVSSICMGVLNGSPFISDPRAVNWVSGVIDAAHALKAKAILMAFFGRGTLRSRADMQKAAAMVKDLASKAAAKGVTLALENTLSAEDNLFILEKAGNPPGLKIYYDIGNSTGNGYDVPGEIRLLGEKICQFHFKDRKTGLLGRGEVKMAPIAEAIADIGYRGWIVLETRKTLGVEATAATNAGFIRGLFARWTGA